MDGWIRIVIFIILNNIALLLGAVIFMYIEYKHAANAPHKNRTELKLTIENLVGRTLNESAFGMVVENVDDYVHSEKECKYRRYESSWKKEINKETYVRWCYFTYTVMTTIGK